MHSYIHPDRGSPLSSFPLVLLVSAANKSGREGERGAGCKTGSKEKRKKKVWLLWLWSKRYACAACPTQLSSAQSSPVQSSPAQPTADTYIVTGGEGQSKREEQSRAARRGAGGGVGGALGKHPMYGMYVQYRYSSTGQQSFLFYPHWLGIL